ncbi:MAG TPA: multicopper oxidase domain-containing protein, partial [Rubrobacteraceae bacterium]|nr:multicopper oxidase domain-containing protein [Rubrobacteraceae bacterium]
MDMSAATYRSLDPTNLNNFVNPLRLPGHEGLFAFLDASNAPVYLVARQEKVGILPGKDTRMLLYRTERDGRVLLNPILLAEKGVGFSAELANGIGREETTVHWHGLHLDWRADGHPSRQVAAGATYRYEFPVLNVGGTYWYHPHAHQDTARQTYLGLAGFFLVRDEEDRRLDEALGLELGETDIPLVIQDKTFAEDGSLVYEPSEMDRSMGVTGDTVLINLTPTPVLETANRFYRFRLLNACNARIFRLALARTNDGEPLVYHVVATDGSLLSRAHAVEELLLAPGERVDVLLDLTGSKPGEEVTLKSLAFDPMHREHEMDGGLDHDAHHDSVHEGHAGRGNGEGAEMGGMNRADASRLGDGQEFYVLRLLVKERADRGVSRPAPRVPEAVSEVPEPGLGRASTRRVTLSVETEGNETRWLIDGRTYDANEYPIVTRRGEVEVWEIRNEERSMPHPMHLHAFRFRVLGRTGSPEQVSRLAVDRQGRTATDLGW